MPRRHFINSVSNPYHVYNRCINKDWFGLPMEDVWELVCEQLWFTAHAFNLEIHSFVLMINHYHLLATSPEGNLSKAIGHFQAEVGKRIVEKTGRINHLWARRFGRSEITKWNHYLNVYKYIYQNPVRAGIVRRPDEYEFSTLKGKLGFAPLFIPLTEDHVLFDESLESTLEWLNRPSEEKSVSVVRKALKKGRFKYSSLDKRPCWLETSLI